MRSDTQLKLIDRINTHRRGERGATDTAASTLSVPTTDYTDPARLAEERRLLHATPSLVGLSGLLPGPETYATVNVGDRSVLLTRDADHQVHAMLNVCSHRAAEVADSCGAAARLSCPYHGWTYHLDGTLAARRRAQFFDDVPNVGLTRLPVVEQHGLLWVSATPDFSLDADSLLGGAEDELAPFDLGSYRLFDTRQYSRRFNWKLAVDTFCEAYHLGTLHRETLSPMIHSDFALFDRFGLHGRMVAARRSITELDDLPPDDQQLLPHTTVLWFIQPNTVLIHQQDHIQLFRSNPGATPDENNLSASLYVPPDAPQPDRYWRKHFDLLIEVTDSEDFTTAAGVQRGYHSGAHSHVVFGRNEPALQHYHLGLAELLSNHRDTPAASTVSQL